MAIDPRIALGVQPMQIENPVNQLAKVLQIKDMQQGQQMNALKMDEYRRSIEDTNALRSALGQPGADPYKVLLGRGKVKEATDYLKGKADVEKTGVETEYKRIEAAHKRVDLMGQSLGWLRQNPSVENAQMLAQYWAANGVADPQKVQGMLAQVQANPTPQAIAQFAEMGFRAALSTKEQLPKLQTNNTGGATVTQGIDPVNGRASLVSSITNTQSPDNAATNQRVAADAAQARALQKRGQDLVDARQREQFDYTRQKDAAERASSGGGKPMTEAQGKANLFGSRMRESDRILQSLEGKYSPMAVNAKMGAEKMPGVGGVAGAVGNAMLSTEGQQAEQAQRDFVNAVLRRESGAVISEPEFANAQKQYFPQPNDTKEVLAQKRRNRQLAIQGMEAEVPGGLRTGGVAPSGGATGDWGNDPLGLRK